VAFKIELWINYLQDAKSIESEKYFKINLLFEQYFRTEFIKYSDSKSINKYLESKNYFEYDEEINWTFLNTKKNAENDYYSKWLKNENLKIERLKKFNRYSEYSENELIKNISHKSYSNQKIYLFLKQYFALKLEFIFILLHLEFLFGDIKPSNNKELQPKLNNLTKGDIIDESNKLIPKVSIEEVYIFFGSYFEMGEKRNKTSCYPVI
jgi:hypothetical protein